MNETPENEVKNEAEEASSNRKDRNSYTDASYIPQDQAPRMPHTYAYAESELRESRQRREEEEKRKSGRKGISGGVAAILCLLCLLVGLSAGLLTMGYRLRGQLAERVLDAKEPVSESLEEIEEDTEPTMAEEEDPGTKADEPAPGEALPTEEEEPSKTEEPESREEAKRPVLASDTEVNEELAATEIYELACQQVVGISTEVAYNSRFGTQIGTVTGSGFIISEDGYILTNYHVVDYAVRGNYPITVMLYNGDTYTATVVGYEDEDSDIAVLKIDAAGLNAATLGDSSSIRVGETVYAVGNPLGELDYTMTRGMISAMDRQITTENEAGESVTINMFQIDAAVNSGNSGGPVYNGEGEIIGIVTAKYSDSYTEMGIEGLGFAIPIDDAIDISNDLIQNGYVRGKAYMGISTKSVSSAAAQYYNMVEGAYIYGVVPGSCAESAGLRTGDIITAVDKFSVGSVSDLQSALKNYNAGDSAVITIFRSGEVLTVDIVFDEKQPTGADAAQNGMDNNGGGYYSYGDFNW